MKKLVLAIILIGSFFSRSYSQEHLLWMQQPSISPDGNWIAFEYKGNIFKVAASGGPAVPLTINSAYNGYPVWSHDGRSIAFASDRYGNFDVFIMPSGGGPATRLTFNSSRDIPYDFSPDNQTVYFGTRRWCCARRVGSSPATSASIRAVQPAKQNLPSSEAAIDPERCSTRHIHSGHAR